MLLVFRFGRLGLDLYKLRGSFVHVVLLQVE
jgi:hypothetical protein